jgi:hypothetical protein
MYRVKPVANESFTPRARPSIVTHYKPKPRTNAQRPRAVMIIDKTEKKEQVNENNLKIARERSFTHG